MKKFNLIGRFLAAAKQTNLFCLPCLTKTFVCMALLLPVALPAFGQHYIGVKGGYGGARGRVHTPRGAAESAMVWNKYTAGAIWKYYSPQQVVGGFSAELEYQARGYRIFDGGSYENSTAVVSDTTSYRAKTRTVSSVTLPLIWQPHLYMMNRRVRFFLSAGVTFSYNLGLGDKYTVSNYTWNAAGRTQTVTSTTSPYKMQTARDVRWNYGWLAGAGIGILMDRWEFFAEGRYYGGMSDVMRTDTKYRLNEERPLRSELDNVFVTMGVCFRLGKGGITEPPLRRRRTAASENDFRNIKLNM